MAATNRINKWFMIFKKVQLWMSRPNFRCANVGNLNLGIWINWLFLSLFINYWLFSLSREKCKFRQLEVNVTKEVFDVRKHSNWVWIHYFIVDTLPNRKIYVRPSCPFVFRYAGKYLSIGITTWAIAVEIFWEREWPKQRAREEKKKPM